MVVIFPYPGLPSRRHHAGLSQDLQGAVNFELAVSDDPLTFLQSAFDEIIVAGPGAQDDLASLVDRLIRSGLFDIHHRPPARTVDA